MISTKTNTSCAALLLWLAVLVVLLVEDKGVDAFIVTPSAIPSGAPSLSSSRRHQSTSNDNDDSSNTSSNNSVGRLEFAYKRVNADPPTELLELASKEPDAIAESIENLVKEQKENAKEQAFIGSLDAWMVASNKSNSKSNKNNDNDNNNDRSLSSVLRYGKRMEDVLTMMETKCATGVTIDAYATVIHLYLGGKEPIAALRVLGRMENQLQLVQQQQQQESEFQNIKGRLIQYNRVLQGLVASTSLSTSSLSVAVQLLMSMCLQEDFSSNPITLYDDDDDDYKNGETLMVGTTCNFLPMNITPDAKSFATVIVQLIPKYYEDERREHYNHFENYKIIHKLIEQARRLDQLNNFLVKKINTTMSKAITDCDDDDNYNNGYIDLKNYIDFVIEKLLYPDLVSIPFDD